MTRLDYGKAKARDRSRAAAHAGRKRSDNDLRQTAYLNFVARHKIACFKCGTTAAAWAKVGTSRRGPWAICTTCTTQAA